MFPYTKYEFCNFISCFEKFVDVCVNSRYLNGLMKIHKNP